VATGRVQAVVGSDGRIVCEQCSIADRFVPRLRGLLGRRGLQDGEGLLLTPSSSIHTFFMRFPIDAVFLDHVLCVVGISLNLRPWKLAGRRGARWVLELPAGKSAQLALRTGDQLRLVEPTRGEA
jgi:uncharacterized membrane protein (UPF0127 family)